MAGEVGRAVVAVVRLAFPIWAVGRDGANDDVRVAGRYLLFFFFSSFFLSSALGLRLLRWGRMGNVQRLLGGSRGQGFVVY